ncbi:MAG: AAA family ATPase [Myxococcales bacterium]
MLGEAYDLGSARFQLLGRFGRSSGVVRAVDATRGTTVAVKALGALCPDEVFRLRREFRTLQALAHSNLVVLHELLEENGKWFVTMEPVEGQNFVAHARSGDRARGGFDERRLRAALIQSAHGLEALHQAGWTHGNITRSTVVVTREGRCVLLDLGLLSATPLTPAVDLYALGTLLLEALTGQPPSGPASSALASSVPLDLKELCIDLLNDDPVSRPSARDVLRRLGSEPVSGVVLHPLRSRLVGRRNEVARLHDALDEARSGKLAVVLIEGEPGVGKSALIRGFMTDLSSAPDVICLSGRCHERESVPFKALDGIMDDLATYLGTLSPSTLAPLLPSPLTPLITMFPVFGGLTQGAPSEHSVLDAREQRTRAFRAVRRLFDALSRRLTLVAIIDDLQWTDADSMTLLAEVLGPPNPPPILFMATMRTGLKPRPSGTFATVPESVAQGARHVNMEPLGPQDAKELALATLADLGGTRDLDLEPVLRASRGHPLFVMELAARLVSMGPDGPVRGIEDAIWERVRALHGSARHLLEALSLAGLPTSLEVLAAAASIEIGEGSRAVLSLTSARLVVAGGLGRHDLIEPYHERVAFTVCQHLSDEAKRRQHEGLAHALDRADADPVTLAAHWTEAGEEPKARACLVRAADAASKSLAFDRAARLYRLALRRGDLGMTSQRYLEAKLADALTNAGRGAEAAAVRLSLAHDADPLEALDLRRMAAEQLLSSGHVDDGLATLREVVRAARIPYPETPLGTLVLLVFLRLLVMLRGFSHQARTEVDARERLRVDCAWSTACGLLMTDTIRGSYFQTYAMLAALRLGDPPRVVRSLCFGSLLEGGSDRAQSERLIERARLLADDLQTSYARALVAGAEGGLAYFWGEGPRSLPLLLQAEALFRDSCIGATFELATVRLMIDRVLICRGKYRELAERTPALVQDAEHRNDLYALLIAKTVAETTLGLAADTPDLVEASLSQASSHLAAGGFHVQHYLWLVARVQLDLYRGDSAQAHARLTEHWRLFERSLLPRVAIIRIQTQDLRARTAIALAASGDPRREALVREAEQIARSLDKEKASWAHAIAKTLRASLAGLSGSHPIEALQTAIDACHDHGMDMHATAARWQLARLRGDHDGAADAESWMRMETVVAPARMAAFLLPGFTA